MLRLETRVPFILTGISPLTVSERTSINNYFKRSDSNYLLANGGLTDAIRRQIASSGLMLQASDVANPTIQVFRSPNTIGHDDWIVQYTAWVDSATPLNLSAIQNRWTTSVVQSMIAAGIPMSESELRRAINDDSHGGTSRYATERLRTASGAPNFSPMPPPPRASLWFSNQGAISAFTNTNTGNTSDGTNSGNGNNSNNTNTGNGNASTGNDNGGGATNANNGGVGNQNHQSKSSIVFPTILMASAVAAALYFKNKESKNTD